MARSKKIAAPVGNALALATITAGPLLLSGPTNKVEDAPKAPTKADLARAEFNQLFAMDPVPARKDMIKAVMAAAGLTKNGAATYLQNYKNKNGLTVHKVAAQ